VPPCQVFALSKNPGATLRLLPDMKTAKPPDLRLYVGSLIRCDEAVEREVRYLGPRRLSAAHYAFDRRVLIPSMLPYLWYWHQRHTPR
jgi:hypothetical protein